MAEWGQLLSDLDPVIDRDQFAPQLAERLAGLSRNGQNAATLARTAAAQGPLPDDHAASALWWRVHRLLPRPDSANPQERLVPGAWTSRLPDLVGDELAARITGSPLWPALVSQVDQALARGWHLPDLIRPPDTTADADPCLALLQRTASVLSGPTDPEPPDLDNDPFDINTVDIDPFGIDTSPGTPPSLDPAGQTWFADLESELALAALVRTSMGPPEPTAEDVRRMIQRDDAWRDCPATRDRLVHINQLTQDYYAARFPGSWAQDYLTERFGVDLAGHQLVQPGYAPAGWTHLVDHLRRRGVTDDEMIAAGVARVASTGRLIDQFRDRVVFPIAPDGDILGFVGRRNPAAGDDPKAGPKYLNTGETPLFHKGDQFYGTLQPGTTPVIVEGPMDAIAVTLGSHGRYSGLAPLGTSLTLQQAASLHHQPSVIIATDADLAGHVAAERDYWQLTCQGLNPLRTDFADGSDPADLLHNHGTAALTAALDHATLMATTMINERIANLPTPRALDEIGRIVAALPAHQWDDLTASSATRLDVPESDLRRHLLRHAQAWNQDPVRAAADAAAGGTDVRTRLRAAATQTRWRQLANRIDPRLTQQPDWPALEASMQRAHQQGHDVEQAVRLLSALDEGSSRPAADLRARLTASFDLIEVGAPAPTRTRPPEECVRGPERP